MSPSHRLCALAMLGQWAFWVPACATLNPCTRAAVPYLAQLDMTARRTSQAESLGCVLGVGDARLGHLSGRLEASAAAAKNNGRDRVYRLSIPEAQFGLERQYASLRLGVAEVRRAQQTESPPRGQVFTLAGAHPLVERSGFRLEARYQWLLVRPKEGPFLAGRQAAKLDVTALLVRSRLRMTLMPSQLASRVFTTRIPSPSEPPSRRGRTLVWRLGLRTRLAPAAVATLRVQEMYLNPQAARRGHRRRLAAGLHLRGDRWNVFFEPEWIWTRRRGAGLGARTRAHYTFVFGPIGRLALQCGAQASHFAAVGVPRRIDVAIAFVGPQRRASGRLFAKILSSDALTWGAQASFRGAQGQRELAASVMQRRTFSRASTRATVCYAHNVGAARLVSSISIEQNVTGPSMFFQLGFRARGSSACLLMRPRAFRATDS